ncbi:hypothetical protein [Thalassospira tepidiphila]|uniref:hypothetical protein n=1 Tax=Thalassospira tepidiphila TaxID=393657 RepID=UPI003AA993BF
MAVIFTECDPEALLEQFRERIQQEENEGRINTWQEKSGYFTHTASQWSQMAFFRPRTNSKQGILRFYIRGPKNTDIPEAVYAYYHGHLIQTFLTHFGESFEHGAATGVPQQRELVN